MVFAVNAKVKRVLLPCILSGAALVPCATAQTAGDAVTGKRAFGTCMSCHSVKPGATGIGPSLAGVAGKKAGINDPQFRYSAAMKAAPAWSDAQLDRFLADPETAVPGTTMAIAPTKDPKKRADIIAYLKAN